MNSCSDARYKEVIIYLFGKAEYSSMGLSNLYLLAYATPSCVK